MAHIKNFNNRPKSKFNPSKFGSTWASIFWKGKPGLPTIGEANQPIIGSLNISNRQFDLTFSECNKIIETLEDAKQGAKIANRLGTTSNGAGSPVGFTEVMSTMYDK
tara:strand:- start:2873 stop:3193 length:321 start_codon:yes stop_codon:yes gene_type:complete